MTLCRAGLQLALRYSSINWEMIKKLRFLAKNHCSELKESAIDLANIRE